MKHLSRLALLFLFSAIPLLANATVIVGGENNVYDGGGIKSGLEMTAAKLNNGGQTDFRVFLLNTLLYILSFMGLAAVIVIIIAGIFLVFGGLNETAIEKAKNLIIYVLVGLIIIILASSLILFWVNAIT